MVMGSITSTINLRITRNPKTFLEMIPRTRPAISRPTKSKILKFRKQKTGKKYFSGKKESESVGRYIETKVGKTAIVIQNVIVSEANSNQISLIISEYVRGVGFDPSGRSNG